MNGTLWTKKRDAQLRQLREQGFSAAQIAVELGGVTRSAVIGRADRMGLRSTKRATRSKAVQKQKLPSQVKPVTWGSVLTKPMALLDLEPHHCRWPIGDAAPYTFCSVQKRDGSSYCQHHSRVAHRS